MTNTLGPPQYLRLGMSDSKKEEAKVIVHTGEHETEEPTRNGGVRIWAAIEVNAEGRPLTLLKIGSYGGDAREFADNRTDALDRFRRGARYE